MAAPTSTSILHNMACLCTSALFALTAFGGSAPQAAETDAVAPVLLAQTAPVRRPNRAIRT